MVNNPINNLSIGKQGEDIACNYLMDRGYKILERNARETWGEVDIIARAQDKTLCFVEVKTLKNMGNSNLTPEDNLTRSKLEKMKRTAEKYAVKHPKLINEDKGWRIDLAAVDILTDGAKQFKIRYYENI